MLKANEARKIANGYNSRAGERMRKHVERLIQERAKSGCFWVTYSYDIDMEYYNVTQQDVNAMAKDLRRIGYEVKDSWLGGSLTIRW